MRERRKTKKKEGRDQLKMEFRRRRRRQNFSIYRAAICWIRVCLLLLHVQFPFNVLTDLTLSVADPISHTSSYYFQ
jgi:hypothetical protein